MQNIVLILDEQKLNQKNAALNRGCATLSTLTKLTLIIF